MKNVDQKEFFDRSKSVYIDSRGYSSHQGVHIGNDRADQKNKSIEFITPTNCGSDLLIHNHIPHTLIIIVSYTHSYTPHYTLSFTMVIDNVDHRRSFIESRTIIAFLSPLDCSSIAMHLPQYCIILTIDVCVYVYVSVVVLSLSLSSTYCCCILRHCSSSASFRRSFPPRSSLSPPSIARSSTSILIVIRSLSFSIPFHRCIIHSWIRHPSLLDSSSSSSSLLLIVAFASAVPSSFSSFASLTSCCIQYEYANQYRYRRRPVVLVVEYG